MSSVRHFYTCILDKSLFTRYEKTRPCLTGHPVTKDSLLTIARDRDREGKLGIARDRDSVLDIARDSVLDIARDRDR